MPGEFGDKDCDTDFKEFRTIEGNTQVNTPL